MRLSLWLSLALTIGGPATEARAAVGATTPFTSVEAESGRLGGGAELHYLTNAPTTEYSSPELEASGHAYVRLAGTGQYVEWTNNTGQPVTFINVRYSIPDSPGGGGITATLDLYVDGSFRQALSLNSKQTWLYENSSTYGGNDQIPADGNPRVFFDDAHTFITGVAIAPGSLIRLQQDATNTAAFYHIDVLDLENPPAPVSQPANSLSITSFGAVANNTNVDSTSAIQTCINTASAQGKSVWIPPGIFYLNTTVGLTGTGVIIEGAGMWYSTIYRNVPLPNNTPLAAVFTLTSCTVRNFAVDANATSRAVVDGCGGSMDLTGNFWLADSIWTQHTMSGFWASGIGGTVRNCRLISIWADGCNLNNVSANANVGNFLTASNNFIRGTGDDAMAINSVNYNLNNGVYTYYAPMTNITFVNNTTVATWGGKGLAIYGGSGHVVMDNYTSDTARYIGLGVGKFGVNGSDLLSATVVGNVIVRSGGNGYQQQQQAMMIGNDGDGQGVGTVANAYCASNVIVDSLYAAVGLSSSTNIVFQNNAIITPAREGIVVGLYALRPGLGNAILYSNTVTGLNAGMAAFTNNSSTYAAVTPIAAVSFSSMSGVVPEPCAEGGQDLAPIQAGDWAIYPNVTLTGVDTFVARVASGSLHSTIEIRLDSPTGTLIGLCAVPTTGDLQAYANAYTSLSSVTGIHDVCLVFIGGAGKLLSLEYFGFFASPPALRPEVRGGGQVCAHRHQRRRRLARGQQFGWRGGAVRGHGRRGRQHRPAQRHQQHVRLRRERRRRPAIGQPDRRWLLGDLHRIRRRCRQYCASSRRQRQIRRRQRAFDPKRTAHQPRQLIRLAGMGGFCRSNGVCDNAFHLQWRPLYRHRQQRRLLGLERCRADQRHDLLLCGRRVQPPRPKHQLRARDRRARQLGSPGLGGHRFHCGIGRPAFQCDRRRPQHPLVNRPAAGQRPMVPVGHGGNQHRDPNRAGRHPFARRLPARLPGPPLP
jgi:hypothetical protein